MESSAPSRSRAAKAASAWPVERPPWLLAVLVAVAVYAAFAGGATAIPESSRVQVVLVALAAFSLAGVSLGRLRADAPPMVWAGIGLLGSLAIWSGVSIEWSIAPDETWLAANNVAAYALACAIAVVAARTYPRAPLVAVLALATLSLLVAAWALGGKLFPGLHIGLLDLDPGDRFARLREPVDYWNALALLAVMGAPACIWVGASRRFAPALRVAAVIGLTVLVLAAALAYSRGAVLAFAAVLAVMVGAGPRRLPRLGVALGALLAAAPSLAIAFSLDDLSSSEVVLGDRIEAGLVLAAVLAVSLLAAGLLTGAWIRMESRIEWSAARSRAVWRGLAVAAVCVALAGTTVLALSDRGLGGSVSDQLESFQEPGGQRDDDPERLLSSNSSNRWEWWQEAAGAFSDRPLAGWGAGSFPLLHSLYRTSEAPARSAHSLPLQLLAETGLLGAGLGIGGLALLGVAATRQVRRTRGAERSARLALLAAAAAWGAHSLVDWHWEIPGVTLPALIALAVAATPSPGRGGTRPLPRKRAIPALAAGAVAALALIGSAALPALSESRRLDALELASDPAKLEQAGDRAETAADLNPFSLEPLFASASIAARRGDVASELGFLTDAAAVQPDNSRPHRRLLAVYSLYGLDHLLDDAYREFLRTDPLYSRQLREPAARSVVLSDYPPAESPTAFGTPPP